MLYEMRNYHCLPGRLPNLLARFNDHTLEIWAKHGIRQVGFWTTLIGSSNQELTYMLAWEFAGRARDQVDGVHERSSLAEGARGQREGRPDHRQPEQPDLDANGVLRAEVTDKRRSSQIGTERAGEGGDGFDAALLPASTGELRAAAVPRGGCPAGPGFPSPKTGRHSGAENAWIEKELVASP